MIIKNNLVNQTDDITKIELVEISFRPHECGRVIL